MADELNGNNVIPTGCIRISNKFIRAIDKYGAMVNLMTLKETSPENQYELIYGQAKPSVDEDLQFKALLRMNPPEDTYKDLHFETRGDALLSFMAYSMQKVGLIGGSLLDYLNVPKMLVGNYIRVGNDHYRIDECKQTAVFMGFPLYQICSLTFVKTILADSKVDNGDENSDSSESAHDSLYNIY